MKTKRLFYVLLFLTITTLVFTACDMPEVKGDGTSKEFVDPTKVKPPTDG